MPKNGESSYVTTASGAYFIEAMGGRNYNETPYSNAINIGNSAVSKLVCNNVVGKSRADAKVKYGYGGARSGIGGLVNGSDGTDGIINYQFIATIDE